MPTLSLGGSAARPAGCWQGPRGYIPARGGPLCHAGTCADTLTGAALPPASPGVGAPGGRVLLGIGAAGDGCSWRWVLPGMGGPGDGCFQGQVLPTMGVPRDRGPQSQLEGLMLPLRPRPCCGRHSGTPAWHRHQHRLASSSGNELCQHQPLQEQVPLQSYYPCGFPVAAKDISALPRENGGQRRGCCPARRRKEPERRVRSRAACTPLAHGSSIIACTLVGGCAGTWEVSGVPSLAGERRQLHACTAPSAAGPPPAPYLLRCYLLANNKGPGQIPTCQLVQEGSPSSQQRN